MDPGILAVLAVVFFLLASFGWYFAGLPGDVQKVRAVTKRERARGDCAVEQLAVERRKSQKLESEKWCAENRPAKLEQRHIS